MHSTAWRGMISTRKGSELLRWEVPKVIVPIASVQLPPERIEEIVSRYRHRPFPPYTNTQRDYATTTSSLTDTAVR